MCLDCGLHKCTGELFEASREDHYKCLETQSRTYLSSGSSCWCTGGVVDFFCQHTIELIAKADTYSLVLEITVAFNAALVDGETTII